MTSKNAKTSQDKHPAEEREYRSMLDQDGGVLGRFQRFTWDFSG
jgi:hypothetical protein